MMVMMIMMMVVMMIMMVMMIIVMAVLFEYVGLELIKRIMVNDNVPQYTTAHAVTSNLSLISVDTTTSAYT